MFFTFKNSVLFFLKNTKGLFLIVYYSHLTFLFFILISLNISYISRLCSSVANSTLEVAGLCGCCMMCLLTHPSVCFLVCFEVSGCELKPSRMIFGNAAGLNEECVPSGKIWLGPSHRAGVPRDTTNLQLFSHSSVLN